MRLSLQRSVALRGTAAVAVGVAAAAAAVVALLSASSPHLLVAAESGIRGEGAVAAGLPGRVLADDAACTSEMDVYRGCMDTNGLLSCDSTCVAPEFEDTKNQLMKFNIWAVGFVSCEAGKYYFCWAMEECECVRPCYAEAMDLLLCQNDAQNCPNEIDMDCRSGSGSSSGGESSNGAGDEDDDAAATTDNDSNYNDDGATAGDDNGGGEGSNGTGDDLTTTGDDYYYDEDDNDDSSSGAESNGCSSELSSYNQCLVENNIEWCDTCAGSAYSVIINELNSNFMSTGSFGSCSSIASYTCAVFQQCECLRPCLAETTTVMECDTQDSVGCDVDCASASSLSMSRDGESSDAAISSNDTTGGGLANHTKEITPAEAAGGTSDGIRVASRARMSLLIVFGTAASIGFSLVA